jgi:hypothetical protein
MRKVDKMTLRVRMDVWAAPCGTVVIFEEGDENTRGRWLVTRVRRSIFDELGEIELSKPKRKILEKPAPRTTDEVRNTLAPSPSSSDRLYNNMVEASKDGAVGMVDYALQIAIEAGGQFVYMSSGYRPLSAGSDHQGNNAEKAARDIAYQGVDGLRGPPHPNLDKAVVKIGRAFGKDFGNGKHPIVENGFEFRGFTVEIFWRTDNPKNHLGHIHVGIHRSAIRSPSPSP